MSLKLKIEFVKTHLYAICSGEFNLNEALSIFNEVLTTASEKNISKVLIDYRESTGQFSTIDRYEYAEKTTECWRGFIISGKIKTIKLAYVGKTPIIDPARFGETVAKNRGAFNFIVTENIEEALEWLDVND